MPDPRLSKGEIDALLSATAEDSGASTETSINLDSDLLNALRAYAQKEGITVNEALHRAIEKLLK